MNRVYSNGEFLRLDATRATHLFTTSFKMLPVDHASMRRPEVGNTNKREVMSHLGDKETDVSAWVRAQ